MARWAFRPIRSTRVGGTMLPDRIDVDLKGDLEEFGFMFYADWRGERWMAYFDSVWVNVNQAAEVSIGQWLPGSDVVAEIDGNVYTMAGEYRAADWQRTTLSVYAGPRYYDVELIVDAEGGILPQPVSYLAATSWTEGVFGARLLRRFGENWRISALADLGGGGSTKSRQAAVSLGYRLPWFSLIGGYRYLAVDYERAGLVLDFALSGPMVGISMDF